MVAVSPKKFLPALFSSKTGKIQRFIAYLFFTLLYAIPTIILTVIGPLIVLFYLPIVWILYKIARPDLEGFVGGPNAIFAQGKQINFPLNIIGIAVLNGKIETQRAKELIEHRVFSLKRPNGELVYERLRKTWVKFLGYAFWTTDYYFDINNHVRDYDYMKEIPPAPSEDELQRMVGNIILEPWTKGRSPWEILFIQNYKGESTVQMIRIDHVLADGFSLYEFYKVITQSEWRVPEFKISNTKLTILQRAMFCLQAPYDIIKYSLLPHDPRVCRLPMQAKFPKREVLFVMSPEISVHVIKEIKQHYNVSYAAVCYAAVCGSLVRAMEAAQEKVPKSTVLGFVLPKPNHPGGLVVHAQLSGAVFPLRCSSREKRLKKVQIALNSATRSTLPNLLDFIAKFVQLFPATYITALSQFTSSLSKINASTANIPVTTGVDYFEGLEISELTTANSLVFDVGMMISFGGVNNKQRVSFCLDRNMFEKEEIARSLGSYFADEIQYYLNSITV